MRFVWGLCQNWSSSPRLCLWRKTRMREAGIVGTWRFRFSTIFSLHYKIQSGLSGQFNVVNFFQSRIALKLCIFYKYIHILHNQGLWFSVLTSLLVAAPQIICPCISVLVLEATCEVRMRALKGCVSSKKVLQGFRTEMNRVAGRSKKDFHFMRGHCFAFQARKWYIFTT